jgi:hypothetical protein
MPRIQPKDTDKRPVASWSTGKPIIGSDRVHRGWFVDAGLDDQLDEAAEAAGWPTGTFSHLDGAEREHWFIPSPLSLFVLIAGVPYRNIGALARNDIAYSGIRCSWNGKSKLGVMALPLPLVEQGYLEPIPFLVSSTSTEDLLTALLSHNQVLDLCERAATKKGKPRTFEFWQVALPIAPGAPVARGGREQTTLISPITCAHPQEPDLPYLRSLLAPKVVATVVAEREMRGEITAWAADPQGQGKGLYRGENPVNPHARGEV